MHFNLFYSQRKENTTLERKGVGFEIMCERHTFYFRDIPFSTDFKPL